MWPQGQDKVHLAREAELGHGTLMPSLKMRSDRVQTGVPASTLETSAAMCVVKALRILIAAFLYDTTTRVL